MSYFLDKIEDAKNNQNGAGKWTNDEKKIYAYEVKLSILDKLFVNSS